jgi:signal transduction histidine kinase
MSRSITTKFILAFLLVGLIVIGLAAAFIWGTTSLEFNRYLQDQRQTAFATAAKAYFEQNNTWDGVETALQQQGVIAPPPQPGGNQPPPFALLDANRVVIIPSGPYLRAQIVAMGTPGQEIPIEINGSVVGTILSSGQPLIKNTFEQQYLNRINQALLIAALGGTLIALILGILLARTLTRPVNELTSATRAMARGDLEQQVPVRSHDELGELAASFNQMSSDLARANQSRRQMTEDIAHDLRTPLTVIGGYAESMRDGVLKPTPERFDAIHTEVQHLQRLVEDLRTLSQADAKELSLNREPVPPSALLERMAQSYRPLAAKQEISLKTETEPGLPDLLADPDRLAQVFGNVLSNSLRHTPQGGEIVLFAHGEDKDIVLGVQDSGSGIAPELLPHIFERFRRGDPSRQDGGSGLGLAIAKAIVELHGGSISAQNNAGKGTTIKIKFPK